MSTNYVHLTETERELIAKMHWEGKGPSEIARALDRDKGTISRELRRNASPEYSCYTPCRAQKRSDQRKLTARHDRPLLKSKKIQKYVRRKLKVGWSPESSLVVSRMVLPVCRSALRRSTSSSIIGIPLIESNSSPNSVAPTGNGASREKGEK